MRSADTDVDVRFWATYLLGELAYADAGTALLPRLFDENPTVRRIAVRSARSLVSGGTDGKLGGEILRFLANVEEAVLAQRLRPLRILLLHLPDASIECGIHPAGEVEVLLEPVHHGPQVDLLLLDRGVVLEQLVLPPVERLHDRVEVTLGRLVLSEVIPKPVAQRQDAEEPATVEQPAVGGVEVFNSTPQLEQSA